MPVEMSNVVSERRNKIDENFELKQYLQYVNSFIFTLRFLFTKLTSIYDRLGDCSKAFVSNGMYLLKVRPRKII